MITRRETRDVRDEQEKIGNAEPALTELNLSTLIRHAIAHFNSLPPEEQAKQRREQAISFAYGNLTCTGRRDYITKESVAAAYDEKHPRG